MHFLSLLTVKSNGILNKIYRLRAEQARCFKRAKNLFYFDFFVIKLSLSVYLISIFHVSIGKLKLDVLISEFWDENEFVVISLRKWFVCIYYYCLSKMKVLNCSCGHSFGTILKLGKIVVIVLS